MGDKCLYQWHCGGCNGTKTEVKRCVLSGRYETERKNAVQEIAESYDRD